ncbi:MAG: pilus assembly protein [Actinobacteria bacterium]|nr:pilus assembly protein [Actinomycetota bacterium]
MEIRGQSTLEFVLVIPVLILFIMAASQFGIMIYQKNILNQAVREGARVISTTNSNEMAHDVIEKICAGLERENLSVSIVPGEPNRRKTGDNVKIELNYKSNGFTAILKKILGKSILIKASGYMRMECS